MIRSLLPCNSMSGIGSCVGARIVDKVWSVGKTVGNFPQGRVGAV